LSIHECAEIVRRGDPEKFLAILMAPLTLRGVLFPIYAFNYEISKIVYAISEPELAEIRLKWWEQELLFSSQNQSNSKHDILQPLSKLILSGDIPLKLFSNIIEARRFDIDKKPHASFEKQTMYIANIFSSLFEISLRASSDKTPDSAVQCVRNYGYALGVANLLKAVPALEMLGKNPIFLNLKTNTKKINLLKSETTNYYNSIIMLAQSGLDSIVKAREMHRISDFDCTALVLSACSVERILKRALRNPKLVQTNKIKISRMYMRFSLIKSKLTKYI
jgi:phytoene synthase